MADKKLISYNEDADVGLRLPLLVRNEIELIAGTAGAAGANNYLIWDAEDGWPERPDNDLPTVWWGGAAPGDAPADQRYGDVWFPASGDGIPLGPILEALQLITAAANTIPYFSAAGVAGNLALSTSTGLGTSDTTLSTQKAVKAYVDAAIAALAVTPDNPLGSGTAHTVAAGHSNRVNSITAATAATLTIPLNATTPLPVGFTAEYLQDGAGQITVTKGNVSMTFKSASGLKTRAQNSVITVWQQAVDVWVIAGDLTT